MEAHKIYCGKTPVVIRTFEHHASVTVRFGFPLPNFEGEQLGGGQGTVPPHFPFHQLLIGEWIDGYLECLLPRRHYTFFNIYAFSGIRTQTLWCKSQRH
ncbi:hypothetical protein TNCV_2254521 [Trichonephila clavipes]|nr:hypothetical protein TNCV_2254521 [Trichonephila clavipes]